MNMQVLLAIGGFVVPATGRKISHTATSTMKGAKVYTTHTPRDRGDGAPPSQLLLVWVSPVCHSSYICNLAHTKPHRERLLLVYVDPSVVSSDANNFTRINKFKFKN